MALGVGPGREALLESLQRRQAVHVAALVGALLVVLDQVSIQVLLHQVNGLIPGLAAHDAEVFVQDGPVQSLHEAVGLGALHLRGAVLDAFQLQEELVGMAIRPAAEFTAVVGQDGLDGGPVLFESRQDMVVEQLHGP